MSPNLWVDDEHAEWYLARADDIPRRREGELAFMEIVLGALVGRAGAVRVLDLGCGDGRLLAMVRAALAQRGVPSTGVALDFNALMLRAAGERFAADILGGQVGVVEHDLTQALPPIGSFDAVVSSFAIHHVPDDGKRRLYGEVFDRLEPGGVFANLEHVASPTTSLHHAFLATLDIHPDDDDPSNLLVDAWVQVGWLRDLGFEDADVHWKWRELALLAGVKPVG